MTQIRILRRWAYAASVAIAAACLTTLWVYLSPTIAWQLYIAGLIERQPAFDIMYPDEPYNLIWLSLLVAAVFFLVWLYRARRNVSVTAGAPRMLNTLWIVPMWAIPFINLFVPGLFVARVAEVSTAEVSTAEPAAGPSRSGLQRLVWAWWACWAVDEAIGTFTSGALNLTVDVSALDWAPAITHLVLYTAAAVLAIVMMFKLASAQEALFRARMPGPDPSAFPTFTVDELRPAD
jgi:heme/copper-type cytochrome/quinol oxidase subunit 2